MPQMMPMNWTFLFIMFNMMFFFSMIMNYFYYLPSIKINSIKNKINNDSKFIHNFWPLN
uniref:ATP synthase F0 subunit 8 n=1 Tax=Thremma gallicum TaxID=1586284 RepID=A0A0U1Z8G8_9NEOP|nr:ATP synthase F0 subunit 8 [Thremma gallicum]